MVKLNKLGLKKRKIGTGRCVCVCVHIKLGYRKFFASLHLGNYSMNNLKNL